LQDARQEHTSIARLSAVNKGVRPSFRLNTVSIENSLVLSITKLDNMVDTRSKVSKQGARRKPRVAKDLPVGQDSSLTLNSGEYPVGYPLVPQFFTTEQLSEAPAQVQEAVIRGICDKRKAPEHQPKTI